MTTDDFRSPSATGNGPVVDTAQLVLPSQVLPESFDLSMPFPYRISPDIERSRSQHMAWVAERGLWKSAAAEATYRIVDQPLICALTHPVATGEDLDLYINAICWSWLWDDSIDKPGPGQASPKWARRILDAYREALYGRPPSTAEIPLVATFRELCLQFNDRTTEHWRHRHEVHWENAFSGFLQEATNNAAQRIPPLDEYLEMRRGTAGIDIALDWVEATSDYELSPQAHQDPYLMTLRQGRVDIVMFTNDLFSARKEWDEGNTDNIVHVLANKNNCSWTEAAHTVEGMIADTLTHCQQTTRALKMSDFYRHTLPGERAIIDRFVEAMEAWNRGNLDWHQHSPRYRAVK
ncbi:hypothetical protein [Nocardia sp. NPDC052316]|uniref:terpene synthase family protein n=1 Tax=Nocardia sp. NPDC052316 TaxID=3364329 RepID=UPI0037CC6C6F